MNVTWSSPSLGSGTSPHELHVGLTVSLIMTPRHQLMTCRLDEPLASVKASNAQTRYSFIPVTDGERILGLLCAERWFDADPPNERVADRYDRLSEGALIGGNASILEFVQLAGTQPYRLVVSGHQIAGLVTQSDLQKLPVRAALFALITGLELAMADLIRVRFPETEAWMSKLSKGRADGVREEIEKARLSESHVDDLLYTQFCDKADIIRRGIPLGISKSKLKQDFDAFQKLRDKLAHANEYAATPDDAAGVAETVQRLFRVQERIEHTMASALAQSTQT